MHVKCMLDITIVCLYQYNLDTVCIYQSIELDTVYRYIYTILDTLSMIEQILDTACKYKCMLDMDIVCVYQYVLDFECLYKYNIILGIAYVYMYQYI